MIRLKLFISCSSFAQKKNQKNGRQNDATLHKPPQTRYFVIHELINSLVFMKCSAFRLAHKEELAF